MLHEKIEFLNYLHKLVKNENDEDIKNCIAKIKKMGLPVFDQVQYQKYSNIQELVAVIMIEYFKLYLDEHEHSRNNTALKSLRKQLPQKYFKTIPLRTFKEWIGHPKSISKKSLLEMTNGNKYEDYNELLFNKGLVEKPVMKGQKLWAVVSDYGYHDPWEPTDETDCHLLGVFSTEAQAYKTLEKNNLYYGDLHMYPIYLNQPAFDLKAWWNFENSFRCDYPEEVELTPTICNVFTDDEDMYDDPMDI